MNVLETLKIDKASILNIKDGDLLFIQLKDNTTAKQVEEITRGFQETINNMGIKNVTIAVSNSIQDIKLIRR